MSKLNFLVFDTRSGSTFLASMLEKFPELGVTLESPLPFTLLTGKAMYVSKRDIKILFDELYGPKRKFYADQKFAEWGIEQEVLREEISAKLPISNKDLLLLILDVYFKKTKPNAQFFIYKGIDFYLLKQLKDAFPESKCIYIYRDGRAVFASKKRTLNLNTGEKMGSDPIVEAKRWVENFSLVENAFFKKDLILVKYERLVERKEEVLKSIRRFLSGDNSSQNSIPSVSRSAYERKIPKMQKDLHPNVGKVPLRSRIDAWEKELTFCEQYFYEKTAYSELKNRGYQPVCYGEFLSRGQILSIIKYKFVLATIRLRYMYSRLKLYSRKPGLLAKKVSLRLKTKR